MTGSGWWERDVIDILIATPISGSENVYYEWSENTARVLANLPQNLRTTIQRFPEPCIDISRDKAVNMAIQLGARWLWFLDSDIVVPQDCLSRLLAHNKDIVGALYVRRHDPPFNEMLRLRKDGMPGLQPIRDGEYQDGELVSCDAIATGTMLIKTDVFEKVPPFQMTIDGQPSRPMWFLWTEYRVPNGACALPNQSVYGGSPIENIQKGEGIYNGYGNQTTVLNTFQRRYNGNVIRIVPRGMRLPIKVTPEHNVLVLRGIKRRTNYKNRYSGRYWDFSKATIGWLQANHLTRNDWVGFPILDEGNQTELIIEDKPHPRSRGYNHIQITSELAYLAGLYFAEGSVSGKTIRFSFGLHEGTLANTALELTKKIFGVNVKIELGDHALNVRVTSHPLGRALKRWFGNGARTKQIPKWILNNTKEIWTQFLLGVFHGDGYVTYNGNAKLPTIGFNIASKDGAIGLFSLLVSLGIRPTLRKYIQPEEAFGHGNSIYVIKILTDYDKLAELFGLLQNKQRKNNQECSFFYNGHLWMKVSKIELEHYEGNVYDLTVANKNSYILEGITVHNSEDFSFCMRARQHGIEIFCDTSIKAKHMGPVRFRPSGSNQLQIEFVGSPMNW